MTKVLQAMYGSSLLLVLFISACGGGGGSSTGDGGSNGNSDINGALKGNVFIGGLREGWSLDLTTGRYTRIPGVDWENTSGVFHPLADFSAYPVDYDGSLFLATITNCLRSNSVPSRYDDCMVVNSRSGQAQADSSYRIFQDIIGEPKLSRNGEYIAFFYDQYGSSSPAELSLIIVDRNFSIVSAAAVLVSGSYTVSSPSLTWLPDNRIAYTFDDAIYLSQPLDVGSTDTLVSFTETEGEPRQITASPDGSQLAFILETDATFRSTTATPWVIDSNGSNRQGLRQLARVEGDKRPSFKFPTWSPDGDKILVTHGRVAANDPLDLGLQGGAYVIPADSNNLLLDDNSADILRIRSYFGMTSGRSNPELTTDFDIDNGTLSWLP